METELTHEELLFVYEYLKDFNKTAAALRVGKPQSWAHVWASRISRKPNVAKAIDDAIGARAERTKIDADWVLLKLAELYETDLSEILRHRPNGDPYYDFSKATPEMLAAIESISINEGKYGTSIKVQIPSKRSLLETIGKHVQVNAYKETVEHTGKTYVIFDEQDKEA